MKHIKPYFRLLAILIVATLLLTYGFPWLSEGQMGKVNSSISFSFEGIGKGLDSKGNPFNINEIKSDTVLKEALSSVGAETDLTVSQLRKLITITPQVGRNALSKITAVSSISGNTEAELEKSVYTGDYVIGIKDEGMPNPLLTKKLSKAVSKAYTASFQKRYLVDSNGAAMYSKEEILLLDYPELAEVLAQEADSLLRYVSVYANSAPTFLSKETGLTFADLKAQAQVIRNQNVDSLSGLINYFVLTKDEGNRKQYEATKLKRSNLNILKAVGRELAVGGALNVYDNSTNYLFMEENVAGSSVASAENQFYGELADSYVDAKNRTIDATYDAAEIQTHIDRLQTPILTAEQQAAYMADVDQDALAIYESIEQMKAKVRTLAKENYDQNIGSKIAITPGSYHVNSFGNPIINLVILLGSVWILTLLLRKGKATVQRSPQGRKVLGVIHEFAGKRQKTKK